jgi:hypothetical protein
MATPTRKSLGKIKVVIGEVDGYGCWWCLSPTLSARQQWTPTNGLV